MGKAAWCWRICYLAPRDDTFWYCLALISALCLLGQELSRLSVLAADFEGFGDDAEEDFPSDFDQSTHVHHPTVAPPPVITQSDFETDRGPPDETSNSIPSPKPSLSPPNFDYWDEDEFEGLPTDQPSQYPPTQTSSKSPEPEPQQPHKQPTHPLSYTIEIASISFLIAFAINYFTGKRENENIALAWASQFATKDSIFEKNFSLLGTGDGKDTPLLLKEGQNVFKFYASGRRFCQGLLATMELTSRHDLISRIYNAVVPCKDQITFEVFMDDDAMDQVIFAVAKKKVAKTMLKEATDLQRFAGLVSATPGSKWVADELSVLAESREVANDLVTDVALDQVFGDKEFRKYGKGFISLHFSDQQRGSHRKMLIFKFILPDIDHMADMTKLVTLVPYYIDVVGRYKLSQQARSKTEAARLKAMQEAYKELQQSRQDAIQKKKAERKMDSKLSAEATRKKEEKDRARQMKKAIPKMRMTRAR